MHEFKAPFKMSFYRQMRNYGAWSIIPAVGEFKRSTFPVRTPSDNYFLIAKKIIDELEILDEIENIQTPVQLIFGGEDRIAPVEDGKILNEKILHSHLMIIPKENHYTTFLSTNSVIATLSWFEKYAQK